MENEILKLYDEYYREHDFSGAGLVKQGDNIIFAKAYGYAHRGFRIENTVDTMFDTASITKLFTAVAILQLIDKGLLGLEDRIMDIINLKGTRISEKVRIKHLLNHTSGIADDADEEAGESYEELFRDKPNYSIRNCIDFLPQFAYREPNFEPGAGVRYNNCAFILLGIAVEELTGINYAEYVTQNIFKACGMDRTAFASKDDGDTGVAEGYFAIRDDNGRVVRWQKNIYSYPPVGTADGGAYSSVYDLDKFIRALKGGKLLSESSTNEILKPHCDVKLYYRTGYILNGYGFEFLYDDSGHLIRISKDGCNVGVAAMFAYYPDSDITSIILANQDSNVWRLHWETGKYILEKAK